MYLLLLILLILILLHCNQKDSNQQQGKLLTLIVPCWKCERWLNDTLSSIQSQVILPAIDVIIVDDGGGLDATPFASTTKFTLIRHNKRRGLSAARNTGAKASGSPFVAFLDPDDVISPFCLERLLLFHIHSQSTQRVRPIAWTFPSVTHVDEHFNVLYRSGAKFSPELMFQVTPYPHQPPSFGIINRHTYLQAGGHCKHVSWWEDLEFFYRLHWKHGLAGQWWPESDLFYYRRHSSSRSAQALRAVGEKAARQEALFQSANCANSGMVVVDLPVSHKYHHLQASLQVAVDVMFVVPWLDRGGADDYDLSVIRALWSRNVTVSIITTHPQALRHNHQETQYRQYTNDIWHVGLITNIASKQDGVDLTDYLFDSRQPRVVWIRNSMAGYRMAKTYSNRAKFLDIQHMDCPTDQLGFEHTSKPYRDQLAKRVVVSQRLQNMTPNSILIHPPVNRTFWSCSSSEQVVRDKHLVLFAGRMVEQKQPLQFVQLCNQLDSKFTCKIIGDDVSAIKALYPHIKVGGWLDKHALRQEMCSAAFLVLTSKNEGIPMTALQAMSCGMQVISMDMGAINEIPGVQLAANTKDIASIINKMETKASDQFGGFPDIDEFDQKVVQLFKDLLTFK